MFPTKQLTCWDAVPYLVNPVNPVQNFVKKTSFHGFVIRMCWEARNHAASIILSVKSVVKCFRRLNSYESSNLNALDNLPRRFALFPFPPFPVFPFSRRKRTKSLAAQPTDDRG